MILDTCKILHHVVYTYRDSKTVIYGHGTDRFSYELAGSDNYMIQAYEKALEEWLNVIHSRNEDICRQGLI